MVILKEFNSVFNTIVNDFIISIYVDEFGYECSRKELEFCNNSIYQQNGGNLWIAFNENNEFVGTIAISRFSDTHVELKKFYVRKDYRGVGVSNDLYATALDFCNGIGVKKVFLWTYGNLKSAVDFYLKKGFVELEHLRKESSAMCFELDL